MQTNTLQDNIVRGQATPQRDLHSHESTIIPTGSLESEEDVNKAVEIIKDGGVAVIQFRGVFGVFVRADHAEAVEKALARVKDGEVRPMVAMMDSRSFLEAVDTTKVHPNLQALTSNPQEYVDRLGGIAIVAAPIKKEFAKHIPDTLLSNKKGVYKMLNLDPSGNPYMVGFISKLVDSGILFVGISSLNQSGREEITQFDKALDFVGSKADVQILLTDPLANDNIHGSFTIIDLETCALVREGHIPSWIIEEALEVKLNRSKTKKENYPHFAGFNEFKDKQAHIDHPRQWRQMALSIAGNVNHQAKV